MTPETEAISQTKEVNLMQQLSLYQIDRGLLDLMDLRETAETEEEKQVADEQIALYVKAELRKADSAIAFRQHCNHMAANAFAESKRLGALGLKWERRLERLEASILAAMLAVGKDKIECNLGTLTVKKCPPSVDPEIDMGLLPDEYANVTVTMSGSRFQFLRRVLRNAFAPELVRELDELAQHTPCKAAIAATLKKTEPCGCVAGIVYGPEGAGSPCGECAGSGRVPARVAGARLITDKVRLEVK